MKPEIYSERFIKYFNHLTDISQIKELNENKNLSNIEENEEENNIENEMEQSTKKEEEEEKENEYILEKLPNIDDEINVNLKEKDDVNFNLKITIMNKKLVKKDTFLKNNNNNVKIKKRPIDLKKK